MSYASKVVILSLVGGAVFGLLPFFSARAKGQRVYCWVALATCVVTSFVVNGLAAIVVALGLAATIKWAPPDSQWRTFIPTCVCVYSAAVVAMVLTTEEPWTECPLPLRLKIGVLASIISSWAAKPIHGLLYASRNAPTKAADHTDFLECPRCNTMIPPGEAKCPKCGWQ